MLNNRGAGREGDIIAGIAWALDRGCDIVSMSLGRPVQPNEPFDPLYEDLAIRAIERGTLIFVAAGNESDRRWGHIAPVSSPANAPSMAAIAAIGADGGVATFSCGGVGVGQVQFCAPGVGVLSAFPGVQAYKRLNGTSMACPHVAGVAALVAEQTGLRGRALLDELNGRVLDLGGKPRDMGAGLARL